jgi:hypothetical protein
MTRLSAILLLCLAFSVPALATDEAGAPPGEPADPVESVPDSALPAVPELEDLPPEVLEMLDPEQIADILATREETRIALAAVNSAIPPDPVATVAVVGFFLTILLGLMATLVLRYRKHARLQETLQLMIEKGADIPPELIAPPVPPHGDMRRGVVLVGAGLSLMILVGLVWGFASGAWAVGLIPAFIGAGYLFVWRLSRRAETS